MPADILILIFRILSLLFLYGFLFLVWRVFIIDTRSRRDETGSNLNPIPYVLIAKESDEEGSDENRVFPLSQTTTIGRSQTNTIVLEDVYVSTLHASISYEKGLCFLTDHESRNGTHINDIPVEGKIALSIGDRIKIGQTVFEFTSSVERPENA